MNSSIHLRNSTNDPKSVRWHFCNVPGRGKSADKSSSTTVIFSGAIESGTITSIKHVIDNEIRGLELAENNHEEFEFHQTSDRVFSPKCRKIRANDGKNYIIVKNISLIDFADLVGIPVQSIKEQAQLPVEAVLARR